MGLLERKEKKKIEKGGGGKTLTRRLLSGAAGMLCRVCCCHPPGMVTIPWRPRASRGHSKNPMATLSFHSHSEHLLLPWASCGYPTAAPTLA